MLSSLIITPGQNKTNSCIQYSKKLRDGKGDGIFISFRIWESNYSSDLVARKGMRELRGEVVRGKVRTRSLSHNVLLIIPVPIERLRRKNIIKNRMFSKWFSQSPERVTSVCTEG